MRRLRLVLIVTGLLLGSIGMTSAQAPSLEVTAPTEGSTVEGTDVTVRFTMSGVSLVPSSVPLDQAGQQEEANHPGEGHLHLMLDLGSVVVWNSTEPYTFTNVPPGEHQLTVEVVNHDHSSLDPPVVQQIRFRTTAAQMVPNTGEPAADPAPAYAGLLALSGIAILAAGLVLRRRAA